MKPAEPTDLMWERSGTGGVPEREASVLARIYALALQKTSAREQDGRGTVPDGRSIETVRKKPP